MEERDILDLLPSIHYAVLCYEYGKLDAFITENNEPTDEHYTCFFSTMYAAVDFVYEDYNEYYNVSKYYYSWNCMMQYYRLCRDYCVKFGVSLKDNPFMREAEHFVERAMLFNHNGGGYGFILQTRINHKWASGLYVTTDEYFNSEFELVEALLMIGAWFDKGVERLKAALKERKISAFPQGAPQKEAA